MAGERGATACGAWCSSGRSRSGARATWTWPPTTTPTWRSPCGAAAAIVGRSTRPVSEGVAWGPLAAVLAILPVAALTELLLIRTFYRVGIHIPREGAFRSVHGVLTHVGSFAFNLSSVLVLAGLTPLAWRAWEASRQPSLKA